jgi:hypothetical protein
MRAQYLVRSSKLPLGGVSLPMPTMLLNILRRYYPYISQHMLIADGWLSNEEAFFL